MLPRHPPGSFAFMAPMVLAVVGCGGASGPAPSPPTGLQVGSMTVTSGAFVRGAPIPIDATCDGKNLSPPLTWSAPPAGTRALAVVVADLDASSGSFTHWLVVDLPPDTVSLPAAVDPAELAKVGAKVGVNDFHEVGYGGPCPPRGEAHRYEFRVFASDRLLQAGDEPTRTSVDAALDLHTLGYGALTAVFGH